MSRNEDITIGYSVLGSIINNQSCQILGLQKITSELVFPDTQSQIIYRGVQDMYIKSLEIDPLTLRDYLKKNKTYKDVGDAAYDEITSYSLNVPNFHSRMELLHDNYLYRTLESTSKNILAEAESKSMSPADLVQTAIQKIEGTLTLDRTRLISTFGQNLSKINTIMSSEAVEDDSDRVSFGYDAIDKYTSCIGGKLIICGARPSMGKTAFACEIVKRMALYNKVPVGVISLEMTSLEYIKRICASHLKWNSYSFDHQFFGNAQRDKFENFKHQFGTAPLYIDDDASVDVLSLPQRILYMHRKYGVKVVVVDHLGLIDLRLGKNSSKEQAIGSMTSGLKKLARKLNIDIIGLYQLSREVERRTPPRPMLSDLKDSGSVEADADVVFLLYRPEYYPQNAYEPKTKQEREKYGMYAGKFIISRNDEIIDLENKLEVIIAKNRNGKIGRLFMDFNKGFQSLEYDAELTEKLAPKQ